MQRSMSGGQQPAPHDIHELQDQETRAATTPRTPEAYQRLAVVVPETYSTSAESEEAAELARREARRTAQLHEDQLRRALEAQQSIVSSHEELRAQLQREHQGRVSAAAGSNPRPCRESPTNKA